MVDVRHSGHAAEHVWLVEHDVVSWIAPDVARIDEPFTGPERGILDGFLDWHRSTLLWKCAGLTGEQLALASVPPSNLSLQPRRRFLSWDPLAQACTQSYPAQLYVDRIRYARGGERHRGARTAGDIHVRGGRGPRAVTAQASAPADYRRG